MNVIQKLIDHYGSAYKAAQVLNVTPQQFHSWKKQGYIPFRRGGQVEEVTGGIIKAIEVYEEAARAGR